MCPIGWLRRALMNHSLSELSAWWVWWLKLFGWRILNHLLVKSHFRLAVRSPPCSLAGPAALKVRSADTPTARASELWLHLHWRQLSSLMQTNSITQPRWTPKYHKPSKTYSSPPGICTTNHTFRSVWSVNSTCGYSHVAVYCTSARIFMCMCGHPLGVGIFWYLTIRFKFWFNICLHLIPVCCLVLLVFLFDCDRQLSVEENKENF